jgi:nitric oxide dioxygenase
MERLSDKTWQVITETQSLFMKHHKDISMLMYKKMFENHPELKPMFANAPFNQPRMFEAAIMAFLVSKDDPDFLHSYRVGICSHHVEAGVKEEHYDMMAEALFDSMSEVMKDEATPEMIDAWKKWFYFMANILMEREKQHYSGEKRLFPEGSKATSDNHLFNHYREP